MADDRSDAKIGEAKWPMSEPRQGPLEQPPLSREQRVDRWCDKFKRQWITGEQPRIETYLLGAVGTDRDKLLRALVTLEMTLRAQAGDRVDPQEYRRRFADDSQVIDDAIESLRTHRDLGQSTISTDDQQEEAESYEYFLTRSNLQKDLPEKIGRYQIIRALGRGGFAIVYLARDIELGREVALKVPRLERFDSQQALEVFVEEARKAAQLDHPGIVQVHDVQREPGLVYIVQRYLPGGDLAQTMREHRLPASRIAKLMIAIAEAVGYAHQHRYVHLDLKPANILLDRDGNPHVADFGLAVHESMQRDLKGHVRGTNIYMSPAQTRGEVHRLDGRSDIWSLGVILYELLTGQRPFTGKTREEVFDQIQHLNPRPPRQVDPSVPAELSRICLVCLAKRAADRYPSTADLIDDLRHWLESGARDGSTGSPPSASAADPGDQPVAKLIPQGLRSFEAEHADFYLDLMPGPHDRDGLPKRVRFWKTQIEKTDPDETFPVGVMYGPSGCGKSSLVKAGLLPRLSEAVLPIYVEATAADTEARLARAIRKRCPDLPAESDLPDLIAQLRDQGGIRGRKALIVLDQFEQWLHAHESRDESHLLPALRHCDGGVVQCLVLVRDEFWMSATRFMQALEVPLVEGHNSAAVDLFDRDHGEKVLAAFGRAYGKLPNEPTPEQARFLRRAVDELAQGSKVICVRLAVFAEMMKSRPWTEETLAEVGGPEGVGVTFLEETFAAETAPPSHRIHQRAVREVLNSLLPDPGTEIKGKMKSYQELRAASGYKDRERDFDALCNILDSEVRLITPTEPDQIPESGIEVFQSPARYYQITHDFLVPSLRDWLTHKQRETPRGRAELQLADRAALWNKRPEKRSLPNVLEWIRILILTDSKRWQEPERMMMRQATKSHLRVWGTVLAVLLAVGISMQRYIAHLNDRSNQSVALGYVQQLANTTPQGLPAFVELVKTYKPQAIPRLEQIAEQEQATDSARLHAACALLELGYSDFSFPVASIRNCQSGECPNLVTALSLAPDSWHDALDRQASEAALAEDRSFQARLAILLLYLGNPSAAQEMLRIRNQTDRGQRTAFETEFIAWHAPLSELAGHVHQIDEAGFRSGICNAMGVADLSNETGDEQRTRLARWTPLLNSWYENDTDAAVHSSAGWLLRTWNLDLPQIDNRSVNDWYQTPVGMTLVRLPPSAASSASSELWISDREISVGLFRRMMQDESYAKNFPNEFPQDWTGVDQAVSPTDEHPVQFTNWYDAVAFCNWLSRSEDLPPCYELTGEKEEVFGDLFDAWRLIDGATGYRLPTEREWEYACNAGASTRYWFGDDAQYLGRYAVYSVNSGTKTESVGSKPCNDWGLFDMHGNVDEWCETPFSERTRVYKGGSWFSTSVKCMTSQSQGNGPIFRGSYLGFRVVRSQAPEDHVADSRSDLPRS
ncbi:SUMF1/EgtB/PvdO family nonheme iron enzyme [Roseiconus nitratireducens]|uniref:SUMF1/EgtB/PvdO family nonheme iron enzyme n=1 Tax=Roseiconus nitratireducens TaxID=2605748 RepID=A0A5M6D6I2_9BACT|nr:bifunctional serine/threonine-protein kinase/formylglycine-generating enzyme family protein [Roseiconus nitratireducens]KAA5543138.1 SUMF1/EgtB/PvdO family nonheme iron enzyme [Roseiconus nitratireducens]